MKRKYPRSSSSSRWVSTLCLATAMMGMLNILWVISYYQQGLLYMNLLLWKQEPHLPSQSSMNATIAASTSTATATTTSSTTSTPSSGSIRPHHAIVLPTTTGATSMGASTPGNIVNQHASSSTMMTHAEIDDDDDDAAVADLNDSNMVQYGGAEGENKSFSHPAPFHHRHVDTDEEEEEEDDDDDDGKKEEEKEENVDDSKNNKMDDDNGDNDAYYYHLSNSSSLPTADALALATEKKQRQQSTEQMKKHLSVTTSRDVIASKTQHLLLGRNKNTITIANTTANTTEKYDGGNDLPPQQGQEQKQQQRHSLKFYMYDHPNITLGDPSFWPWGYRNRAAFKMCLDEIYFDESIFVVLEQSPLRTWDAKEADVIIAPIPMGRIFSSKNASALWDLSFSTLSQQPLFQEYQGGNKHLLIATGFPLFKNRNDALRRHYDSVYNMTLVQSWDPNGVADAIRQGYSHFHEYQPAFEKVKPVSRSSISLGLGTKPDSSIVPIPDFLHYPTVMSLPLQRPSMDQWKNASNFIFYHTRTEPSVWNSTIYRQVAVTNITTNSSRLPKSSIGWDINGQEWLREYVDSKFCLVIRGDSPHSKAFMRSVRVGCIPVVIADCLPVYAPVMKSILNMSDYTVMLDEKKFVEDPEGELMKLLDLSDEEIQDKIEHLAFAQRVMMMDHPESLFVEALLHEAVEVFEKQQSLVSF